jgi:transposase
VQDRDGGLLLLATLFGKFPFLEKLFADSAYQGPIFADGLTKILPYLKTEIVKRSDRASGFVPLPKRWIVERTIAWLNRCRRLAKDWENLNDSGLAFFELRRRHSCLSTAYVVSMPSACPSCAIRQSLMGTKIFRGGWNFAAGLQKAAAPYCGPDLFGGRGRSPPPFGAEPDTATGVISPIFIFVGGRHRTRSTSDGIL